MPNKLTDIEPMEVSLVWRAANKRKYLLLKGEDIMDEILELLELDLEEEEAVRDRLDKADLSEEAKEAVVASLKLLSAYKDELPTDIIKTLADLLGYGYAYAAPEKGEEEEEDLEKMEELPEWARDRFEETREALEGTNEDLRQEIQLRKTREYKEKATKLESLPGDVGKLGKLLLKADTFDGSFGEELMELLKKWNKSFQSMYKQLGKDVEGNAGADAYDEVHKMAEQKVANGEVDTIQKAVSKVLKDHPDLYEKYRKER